MVNTVWHHSYEEGQDNPPLMGEGRVGVNPGAASVSPPIRTFPRQGGRTTRPDTSPCEPAEGEGGVCRARARTEQYWRG